jgi:hypothetical protein
MWDRVSIRMRVDPWIAMPSRTFETLRAKDLVPGTWFFERKQLYILAFKDPRIALSFSSNTTCKRTRTSSFPQNEASDPSPGIWLSHVQAEWEFQVQTVNAVRGSGGKDFGGGKTKMTDHMAGSLDR